VVEVCAAVPARNAGLRILSQATEKPQRRRRRRRSGSSSRRQVMQLR
jgi:hypothetical protein